MPAHSDEQEILRTGRPVVGKEEKETWLDGRVRWVSTTKMPYRDSNKTTGFAWYGCPARQLLSMP